MLWPLEIVWEFQQKVEIVITALVILTAVMNGNQKRWTTNCKKKPPEELLLMLNSEILMTYELEC
jgi:hypothetical protein